MINELSSSRVGPHQFRSQSNCELKDSIEKPVETGENNMQSRAEINRINGLKQLHSRVPLVSLRVKAKVNAGGIGCPTWLH